MRLELFHSGDLAAARTRAMAWRRGYWHRQGWESIEGMCNICGEITRFSYTDRRAARESLLCASCGSTSRYRSLARGILAALVEMRGIESDALVRLPPDLARPRFRILDTQVPFYARTSAYPIPDILKRCTWIDVHCSIHSPELPWGARLGRNVSNQSLEHLTFENDRFDLVLTSDVLEHVRLDALAHAEIARVLKPGGRYLFTVPHRRSIRCTMQRVLVRDPDDPTKDEFAMEPEYHGDVRSSSRRALAYRVYGLDLDSQLEALGLRVVYEKRDHERSAIVNTELFICHKAP